MTFFFSGGREDPYAGETRILVPSPKVATYDLQPEMSCPEVTAKLVEAIRLAASSTSSSATSPTPTWSATPATSPPRSRPREAVDVAIGAVEAAVRDTGGALLITADHGNLEMMRDPDTGQPHTAHTVGPVPFVYVGPRAAIAAQRRRVARRRADHARPARPAAAGRDDRPAACSRPA